MPFFPTGPLLRHTTHISHVPGLTQTGLIPGCPKFAQKGNTPPGRAHPRPATMTSSARCHVVVPMSSQSPYAMLRLLTQMPSRHGLEHTRPSPGRIAHGPSPEPRQTQPPPCATSNQNRQSGPPPPPARNTDYPPTRPDRAHDDACPADAAPTLALLDTRY